MAAHDEFSADAVVAETNFGGEMVTSNLRAADSFPRIQEVNAKRGKALRAEPVVGLYERKLVHHPFDGLPDLESQMTEWVPYEDTDSPDRVDALVYAVTQLAKGAVPAGVSSPTNLRRDPDGRLRIIRGGAA